MSNDQISVIVSGVVAVSAVLLAPIIGLISDQLKWKRNQKNEKLLKIEKTTKDLLTTIASTTPLAEFSELYEAQIYQGEIHGKFLMWEQVVWDKCTRRNRKSIEAMRHTISNGNVDNLYKDSDNLVKVILAITRNVTKRFR